MSVYTDSFAIKYTVQHLREQTEVAMIHACEDIKNEAPSTPDHANRIAWATWANKNSSQAYEPFRWPVAMNPSIQAQIAIDPSGQTVPDSDVQFVVNANVNAVIADWVANPSPA
jgi:hypothetical protein